MNPKKIALLVAAGLLLASCGGQPASSSVPSVEPSGESSIVTEAATYSDATPNTPYGKLSDFSAKSGEIKVGETLKFKVTPSEDFLIDKVYVNKNEVQKGADGFYSAVMAKGNNRIEAKYKVDPTVDFVEKFKLNIDDVTFFRLFNKKNLMDFRAKGIELMNLPQNEDGFLNVVDGDTTHFETFNKHYTVKVRYLGIDTPESTSEIEEWGKSASNYSKDLFTNRAKWVILQSQGWARGDDDKAATVDGNQRSLAYVWYSEKDEPTKDDFKCVNLEMVYQGYSQGIGSKEDMGEDYYYMFDKAAKSAEANKRHQFSGEDDPTYDYTVDRGGAPRDLELKELYAKRDIQYDADHKHITGDNNIYTDVKTLTKITGYVTRVIGYSFYLQDKPSYERGPDGSAPEAYGIYVFSFSEHPIHVGDYVSVVGVLSVYSGTYQLQGVSWHDFNPNYNRDMKIISRDHEIKPIELTAAEFNAKQYDQVLVKVTEEVTFKGKGSGTFASHFGGIQEVDKNNDAYPFYYSTNKIVFYGDTTGGTEVRFTQDQDVLLTYGVESSLTYKFYIGGESYYYPGFAEYVANSTAIENAKKGKYVHEVEKEDGSTETVTETIDASKLLYHNYSTKKGVVAGISQKYVSTSGSVNTACYQVTIASPADVTLQEATA